jgi:signal transduction histidine kinase
MPLMMKPNPESASSPELSAQDIQNRYEFVFKTTGDGVLVLDTEGVIERINPAAAAMLGVTVDNVRGQPARVVFKANFSLMTLLDRPDEQAVDVRLPRKRFAVGVASRMADHSQIVVLQDVTEKRDLDSRRDALSHTIAHDLRNPLSAISGFAELVVKFGEINPQQEKFLTRIRQTAAKMHDMAKPLVDLAWIEAGMPLAHRPIQMSDIIQSVVGELSALAQSRKITIVISLQRPMPLMMGDPERMRVVVYNLLHNAVSYSHPEQPIMIHAWSDEQEIYCSVTDRGIGIADDELDQIFDRMYRSKDDRVREIAGGGLGLTVAKTIIERHGGDLWATSRYDGGSTFTFVVPTAQKQ